MTDKPFDPVLQSERTLLGWQRTVLAQCVAATLAPRFAAPQLGFGAAILGAASVMLSLVAYLGVRYRYRHARRVWPESDSLPRPSAWPLAVLAGSTITLGLLAVILAFGGARG